jgi:Rrf2 family protein
MKLSSKGRYAVQAVFDLAYHNEGKAAQIRDICARQGIPSRFLEQVFRDLKRVGIVRSKRGPRGGYELARPTAEVRLGDVIRAIEGATMLGATELRARGTGHDVLRDVLGSVARKIEACLDEVTLSDLCERAEQQGLARSSPTRYVYAI